MHVRSRLSVVAAVVAMMCATVGIPPAQASAPSAWYQGGANQARTGFNATESRLVYGHVRTLHPVWTRTTPVPCCGVTLAQTVSANGLAYYYSGDSDLKAVDTTTGATRWTVSLPECASSDAAPSIHLGVLVVPTSECSPDDFNSWLSGYDAATGRHLWSWQSAESMSAPVTVNGVAYVLSRDPDDLSVRIDAIDVRTGADEWTVKPSYPALSLAADGTQVYVCGPDTAQALAPASGHAVWTRTVPGGDVRVSAGHVVFAGSAAGQQVITSFTAAGARQWRSTVAGTPSYSIAATTTELISAGSGTVRALALSTGATHWTHSVAGDVSNQPAIAGHVVYVPTLSGSSARVYALHDTDGAQLWTHRFDASSGTFADSNAVSVAAGSLFVSLEGTGVVALRP